MIIIKSNMMGFGEVSGDPYPDLVVPEQYFHLPSMYAWDQFSIDLTFTNSSGSGLTANTIPASSVTVTSKPIVETITVLSPNSIRISSDNADTFLDEYYQFLDKLKSLVVAPPTIEEYYVLIRYKMPNPTVKEITRTVRVVFPDDLISLNPGFTEDVTITQSVHWRYQAAVANVSDLVSRGQV